MMAELKNYRRIPLYSDKRWFDDGGVIGYSHSKIIKISELPPLPFGYIFLVDKSRNYLIDDDDNYLIASKF